MQKSDAPAAPPTTRECWTCKMMLAASHFYKGDIIKYYNCKACENARHRARKTQNAPKPACLKCSKVLDIDHEEQRFVYARCCGMQYRYQKKRNGTYYPGKAACETCDKFGVCVCYKLRAPRTMDHAMLDAIFD